MTQTATIIGGGAIATGWAARFVLHGWNVQVFDPDTDAPRAFKAAMTHARIALPGLYDTALPPEGTLTFHDTLPDALKTAHWIHDCTRDDLDAKQDLFKTVQNHCDGAAIIASTTRFTPQQLQQNATRPAQIIVCRAHDPVYLLPVVDLETTPENADLRPRVDQILHSIGMAVHAPDPMLHAFASINAEPQADRDATLVALLRALKYRNTGMGAILNRHDITLNQTAKIPQTLHDINDPAAPIRTVDRTVPLDWTDYNGHMTEARYLHAFADATDRLMLIIGCTPDYIAQGGSYFTVQTHIRHLDEVHAGTPIQITTQILTGQGKTLHLFHKMHAGARLLATGEHLLLHVDLNTRRTCDPAPNLAAALTRLATAHADLPRPDGVGASVGQR